MADSIKPLNPNIGAIGGQTSTNNTRSIDKGGLSFRDALGSLTSGLAAPGAAPAPGAIKFSNHAVERMQRRGIKYTPDQLETIGRAVDKAAAKGSKETLVLTDDSALIVSVNNKTVVTVMDKLQLKENVFTNIDSTVVI
jgi:flagellar operon protein